MASGGSIQEVSIDGRIFAVAADADGSRDLGGFTVETQMNGDGTARYVFTRKAWMFEGLQLVIDDVRSDQEFLQEKQNAKVESRMTFTTVTGFTYEGKGKITGDLKASTNNVTAALTFSGGGVMRQQ